MNDLNEPTLFSQGSSGNVEWLKCYARHNAIKKLGYFNDVRSFLIDEPVYRAIMEKNIQSLEGIRDYCGQLNERNYFGVMQTLMQAEEAYGAINMRRYDMFNQKLFFKYNDNTLKYFGVWVDGLATGEPALMKNDIILLEDPETGQFKKGQVHAIIGTVAQISHERFEQNRVFLEKPLNISFISQGILYKFFEEALSSAECEPTIRSRIFESCSSDSDWLQKPKISIDPALELANERLSQLNEWQRQAVEGILAAECRPKPYILFGPPGTGKTHTLVEAVVQVYERDSRAKILFCANSNICVDHIVEKLKKVIPPQQIQRLTAGDTIRSQFGRMHAGRIHVTTNVKSYNLMRNFTYDYVIIDEAGHAQEPESLLPICSLRRDGCLVLAGDPKQLGPVVQCEQASKLGLGTSLFCRLFDFDIYQRNAETNKYDANYITKLLLCYRCDPRIMATSNKLFYDNELDCLNKTPPSLMKLIKLGGPLQFHHVNGEESKWKDSTSWRNEKEADCCVNLIIRLCHIGLEPSQIGLISPYKLQSKLIYNKLKQRAPILFKKRKEVPLDECNGTNRIANRAAMNDEMNCKIDTVDAFQGNEREVIIISTVRTSTHCRLDFMDEPRRFNVALSRAKWLLIVVGREEALMRCPNWRDFMSRTAEGEISGFLSSIHDDQLKLNQDGDDATKTDEATKTDDVADIVDRFASSSLT